MFKTILKQITPFVIIIGVFIWAFGIANTGLSVVEQHQVQYGTYTWNFYRINFALYLQNLENSVDIRILGNIKIQPPNIWDAFPSGNMDVLKALKAFINGVTYCFDWVIFILNIIIVIPLKVCLYPVNILFSLFGFNTTDQEWVSAIKYLLEKQIPYIPKWF